MNTKYWYFYHKKDIMTKKTSITLEKNFEQKANILREAIEAGERSGYEKNFDPVKHLEKLNQSFE